MTGIGVAIVPHNLGYVLMMHRIDLDWWEFPGGKLEQNETLMEAAIRELFEETNLKPMSISSVSSITHPYRFGDYIMWTDYIFHADVCRTEKLMEPDKYDEMRWFDISKLPIKEMWSSATKVFLKWYNR